MYNVIIDDNEELIEKYANLIQHLMVTDDIQEEVPEKDIKQVVRKIMPKQGGNKKCYEYTIEEDMLSYNSSLHTDQNRNSQQINYR